MEITISGLEFRMRRACVGISFSGYFDLGSVGLWFLGQGLRKKV